MLFKKHVLASLMCAAFFAAAADAQKVFVLPGSGGQTVTVLGESTAGAPVSITAPNSAFLALARPDGNRYYVLSRSDAETLLILDQALNVIRRISLGSAVEAAEITPDGRLLVVLTSVLRIFDLSTDSEIIASTPVDVGVNPVGFAISQDSRRIFVLSPSAQRVIAVDITSPVQPRIAGAALLPGGEYTGISVGPNGLVYASLTNQIAVIDPETVTTIEPAIGVNGVPGPLRFTPDGLRGIAANRLITTGTAAFVVDLENRTVMTVPSVSVVLEDVVTVSNSRAIARSNQGTLLDLTIAGAVSAKQAEFGGAETLSGVTGIAVSNEFPAARYLYVAARDYFYRIDLAGNTVEPGGKIPLQQTGQVSYAGVPGAGPVTAAVTYNNNQGVQTGQAPRPLVVRFLNAAGKPVAGAPVTFTTGSAGVTIAQPNAVTNAQGIARTAIAVPATAGNYSVDAISGAVKAVFNLAVGTISGGGIPGGVGLSIFSGNGQLVPEISSSISPLVVQVLNADRTPVVGQTVTFEVTSGPFSISPTVTGFTCVGGICTTNTEGKAAVNLTASAITTGRSFEQGLVTARLPDGRSVLFNVVVYQRTAPDGSFVIEPQIELLKPQQGQTVEGPVGGKLAEVIQARIVAGGRADIGLPLANVGISASTGNTDPTLGPVVSCEGNPLSGADGVVTCDLLLGGLVGEAPLMITIGGGARVYQRSVRVTVGAPSQIQIIQGNNQSGNAGQKLPLALIVAVLDAAGNPLSNASVQWETPLANSATLSNVRNTTDSNGRASAEVTLGATPGAIPIRVTAGTATVTFNLTANVSITGLAKVSGDGQVAVVGQAFAQPLVVQVSDAQGRPVPGASVTFAVSGGVSAVVGSPSAATDAQGRALTTVIAGPSAGTTTVRASLGNLSVSFTLTSRLPGPVLTAADFRNAASGQAGVTPGGIATLRGSGILTGIQGLVIANPTAPGPLPTQFRGVEIQFGGVPAPILWMNSGGGIDEVAFQVPFEVSPGTASVTIRSAGGGSSTIPNVQVLPIQPGLFETGPAGARYAAATRPDGSFVSASNPARRGERIRIYLTGLGQTSPGWGTNRVGVDGQRVILDAVVGVNNEGVETESAMALPGYIGLYVVTFTVPAATAPGNAPLGFALRDGDNLVFSNGSTLPIQ